jgi:hypothetical protein
MTGSASASTQQISLLHISDLHRDPGSAIRNDALLNSLENDRQRYTIKEAPLSVHLTSS